MTQKQIKKALSRYQYWNENDCFWFFFTQYKVIKMVTKFFLLTTSSKVSVDVFMFISRFWNSIYVVTTYLETIFNLTHLKVCFFLMAFIGTT